MPASRSRKDRAMRTQKVVAEWFADRGFPHAETTGSGRSGLDVLGMPGLSCEVKARADLALPSWLRQASRNAAGGVPFVVHRPNGFGEATMADWPVTMRLEDWTRLVRAAGYGDPEPPTLRTLPDEPGVSAGTLGVATPPRTGLSRTAPVPPDETLNHRRA